ncbi:MAG TPA: disulfide bond formation protein B [Noviherbaspirillum sp.]|uniref:disulfide bond formation protein B n=1 Tax=Noviherbaspirillum sp. TaxID=1926288 RepID=UPI002D6F3279|nr:disulfide bond formation protein B [Noviherbaspirillum sp.]HYD94213.1 disulfide bond formation protein B [Noviherbaspirillum sp.]
MKTSKPVLVAVGVIALGLVGFALFLQHVKGQMPCPLCVIQRYAFVILALVCFLFAALPRAATRFGSLLGVLVALGGAGVAGWHVWVKAHPTVSCGVDPLETALNRYPTAELLPFVFKADGFCSAEYPPILGLSNPQWSLIWFSGLALVLVWAALRRGQ